MYRLGSSSDLPRSGVTADSSTLPMPAAVLLLKYSTQETPHRTVVKIQVLQGPRPRLLRLRSLHCREERICGLWAEACWFGARVCAPRRTLSIKQSDRHLGSWQQTGLSVAHARMLRYLHGLHGVSGSTCWLELYVFTPKKWNVGSRQPASLPAGLPAVFSRRLLCQPHTYE